MTTVAETEIRTIKRPRNGEEDPIIIAQRFLNIFRQLHIFSEEKKESFNKMLLEQPAEIRGALRSLPGGGLLQDYIDDLESKAGIVSEQPAAAPVEMADEEVAKAKILATALAEAQLQATAKMQQTQPQPAAVQPQVQAAPAPTAAPAAMMSAPSKVEMGDNFAKELAAALSTAIQTNNSAQKEDIKEMIKTLGETQLEIVKVLQNENAERKEEAEGLTRMLTESQAQIAQLLSERNNIAATNESAPVGQTQTQPANSEENMQILKVLAKSQIMIAQALNKPQQPASPQPAETPTAEQPKPAANDDINMQLLKLMAASQQHIAKTLSTIEERSQNSDGREVIQALENSQLQFARALETITENHKNDTLAISQAITTSQQELAKMFVQYNTQNNMQNRNETANSNNNANNIQINTADYSAQLNLIADKLSAVQSFNTQAFEEVMAQTVKAQSELYRDVALAQTKELSSIISLALKESQQMSTENIIKALKEMPKATTVVEKVVTVPQFASPAETTPAAAPEFAAREEPPVSEDVFVPAAEEALPPESETVSAVVEQTNIIADEAPKKKKKKKKKKKDRTAETAGNENEPTDDTFFAAPETVDNLEPYTENNSAADGFAADAEYDIPVTALPEEPINDYNENIEFPVEETGGETDFVPAEEVYDVPNKAAFEDVAQEASFSEESDPFWDNAAGEDVLIAEEPEQSVAETVAEDAPAEAQTGFSGTESSGWSWLDEQEDGEPIDLDAVYEPLPREEVQTASENADESDENWEWEYEEIPENEVSDGNQDWEWEYEEVPAEEDAANAQDWEWEYEEVSDEDASAVQMTEADKIFNNENLAPIATNSPIKSGDLFFQKDVYQGPEPALTAIGLPDGNLNIAIKDSSAADNKDDPYQNSDTKD